MKPVLTGEDLTAHVLGTLRAGPGMRTFSVTCPGCEANVPYIRNLGQVGIHNVDGSLDPDSEAGLCDWSFRELEGARDIQDLLPYLTMLEAIEEGIGRPLPPASAPRPGSRPEEPTAGALAEAIAMGRGHVSGYAPW